MSHRLDVLKALKNVIANALPGAQVMGLDGDEVAPQRVPDGGRVIVRTGDPGQPEVDLSPARYNYDHSIPIEIAAYKSAGRTAEEALDDMLMAIDAAILADRFLGGLCTYLDAMAPATDDIFTEGATPLRGADLMLVASYTTTSPLT